jgi:hypothetical protein
MEKGPAMGKTQKIHARLLSRTNLLPFAQNHKTWHILLTMLHSLRTHYRGQVLTVFLNQGLHGLPEAPVATERHAKKKDTPHPAHTLPGLA